MLQYTGAEVVLSPEPLRIPATTIDTVWTRGRSTKTGAIVGAVLGAGLGVVAGNTFGEENAGSARNIVGMGGLGALAGSLVGLVIGTTIPRWHRRYP
jgi:ABC-type branched-subunit amino acid transport system permease subunit